MGFLKNSGEQERLSPAIVRLSVKRVRSGARVLESVGVVVKLVPAATMLLARLVWDSWCDAAAHGIKHPQL